MPMVTCSKCRAQLRVVPGATTVRCGYCQAVTRTINPPRPLAQQVGRKKAVIIGIDYINSNFKLEGCITDAKSIRRLLTTRFNFPDSGIRMLTEKEKDRNRIPTGDNIRMAMDWLVTGVRAGDSLVFFFAGHGFRKNAIQGEEKDGFNENLWPSDYKNGKILDDEINEIMVNPIPRGAKLTLILDCCRSGTMADLPFLCKMNRAGKYVWEDHRPKSGIWKGTNGGEAISFSGCDNHQLSDEIINENSVVEGGAMTYSFIQAIGSGHASTYGSLLYAMRDAINNWFKEKPVEKIQVPQLCANEPFNIFAKPFSL